MTNSYLEKFKSSNVYKTLTQDQKKFFDLALNDQNVLLTGPAGTGKSYCIDILFKFFEENDMKLVKTASTGIAALNIGGTTIHSWSGIGIAEERVDYILQKVMGSKAKDRIRYAHRLVIDEISMLGSKILDILHYIFCKVRGNEEPFGGIKVILCGDFCQLPPVEKGYNSASFAFESMIWKFANIKTVLLTEVVRQKDKEFSQLLNDIRVGKTENLFLIREKLNKKLPPKEIKPMRIFSTKAEVDRINNKELESLPGKAYEYVADEWGSDYSLQFFEKNCQARKSITLKEKAQVVLVSNIDLASGLVNGSMGVVDGFEKKEGTIFPLVLFNNGERRLIDNYTWEIKEEVPSNNDGSVVYKVVAQRTQIPLRLGWASTIHSVQGTTLDSVEIDLNKIFESGQAYVALSRCRTLEGMEITCDERKFSEKLFRPHKKALDFYNNIK